MRHLRTQQGQSMAEYAILFAIVIGAAIAMQQYVKSRLQGAVRGSADGYTTAVSSGGLNAAAFEPIRTTTSASSQTDGLNMTSATTGNRGLTSSSTTNSTTTK